MAKGPKQSIEPTTKSADALRLGVEACEKSVVAKANLIGSYSEGHDMDFSVDDTYQLYAKVRDGLLDKKDSEGIRLLKEMVNNGRAYFEAIESQHLLRRTKVPRAALAAEMARSDAHNKFIESLINLETHLTTRYSGGSLGNGIYWGLHKSHLTTPYEEDERGFIRSFGFAFLKGICDHIKKQK